MEENPSILSLAPKVLTEEKDLKQIQPYLSLLKKAVLDKDITNIAISGNYGSGKSTVIKTFQALNPEFKYLNVSLASFQEIENNDNLERRLEVSILQQIFYHVKPTSIPDSKFRRIVSFGFWKSIGIALCIILWLYSILAIFYFNQIDKINFKNWSLDSPVDWLAIIYYLIFLIGLSFLIIELTRILTNSKINKINIKGEIEIGEKVNKSVFNEHLEEILYFFEKTDFNVLIIEDLDRFKNTQIFTKLREINTLLNNFESVKNNRKINFIYAVKDEIFTDKTIRVKFFDLIIPIIPFINQSNASEQLTKLIKKNNLQEVLSTEFTNDVVSFINDIDMRLLINIFLEYNIYRENLKPADHNQDSLFSIIVYKNLYPEDFAKLTRNDGDLYSVLSNKEILIENLESLVKKEIEEITSEIEKIENETIGSNENLRRIYVSKIIEKYPTMVEIELDYVTMPIIKIIEKEKFDNIAKETNIIYYYTENYNANHFLRKKSTFSFKNIESEINPKLSFKERENLISLKGNKRIDLLKNKLRPLKAKIEKIESYSLSEIFQRINISEYTIGCSDNPLIKSLIVNGYINENYQNFISLFHEESITEKDFKFLNSVLSGSLLPFDYKLDNTDNLLKKINSKYFKRNSILNHLVIDTILLKEDFIEQKNFLFDFLGEEGEFSIKFIHAYIKRGINSTQFFKSISAKFDGFWDNILSSNISDDDIDMYLKNIVMSAAIEDIKKFDSGVEPISHYIEYSPEFLNLVSDLEKEKVFQVLEILNITFEELPKQVGSVNDIFNYVLENNHYALNLHNILIILDLNDKDTSLYTSIVNSNCQPLINYIEERIKDFVEGILLPNNESIKESIIPFLRLLNHPNIPLILKHHIIEKQEGHIEELGKVEDFEVQKLLLKEFKAIPSWSNVFTYLDNLEEEQFDEILIDYLNSEKVYSKLENFKIDKATKIPDEDIKRISSIIIHTNELNLETFKSLIKSIPYRYSTLNFSKLSESKVSWILESKFLTFSVNGFKLLSGSFPEYRISFIKIYPEKFLEAFNDLEVDDKLIASILKSKTIKTEQKYLLLKKIDPELFIRNFEIASESCNILAISPYFPLSFEQIGKMFSFNFNWESKIKLLIKHFDFLNSEEIISLSEKLTSNKYYSNLFQNRKRPTFDKNELNRLLFTKLEKKGYIKNFDINPKNENEYRVIANY